MLSQFGFIFAICCTLFCSTFLFTNCNPHGYDESVKLVFSTDTLMFDTLFTTVSSTTKNFTVYNPSSEPVKLDILLAGGAQSYYSINVDGVAGTEFHDVEIAAHDSLFVFVKVTINPTSQSTPYLVTDSVIFYNTQRRQSVQLAAFGQDAHFIIPDHFTSSRNYRIVAHEHEHTHWTNDKPWVIYGWAVVDSLGKLTIDPGTHVYVHNGGGIWVFRYGNIQVNGTVDNPVVFAGDQLSSFYDHDYAQWDRIWINESTEDNVINHAIITNAAIGLQIESLEEYLKGKTIVNNTIIQNNKNVGVLGRTANLEMNNCQISNNGSYSIALQVGDYTLNHLTIANYYSQNARQDPAFGLSNFYEKDNFLILGNTNLVCNNSIIYGYLYNEIVASKNDEVDLDYQFNNCLIKQMDSESHFHNCLLNKDPLFIDKYKQNYNIEATSPAIDAGKTDLGITTDLMGRMRNGIPDIGAYEYYPIPENRRWQRR